jgi:enoyl-CoA hydratase
MKKYQNILLSIENQVAIITINRPKQLNALNTQTIKELNECFIYCSKNLDVRVIIITGSSDKAFVAGADIKEFADFSIEQGKELSKKGHESLFNLVEDLDIPVIAAINGFALGGGLELAMASHIRIASENAKLGLPEVSLGVIPGYGGTQRLSQLIGKGKSLELILTAGMISAGEAEKLKLVNYVVSQEDLIPKCIEIAKKIIKNSPIALSAAIKAVNAGYTNGLDGMEEEIKQFGSCFKTNDFIEGTSAFLERRKAEFRR